MNPEPNLSSNLIQTIYELLSHNYVVLAYFGSFVIALLLTIKNPSRGNLILVIGLALLVFNFEFEKHISEPLRAQTELSLTRGGSYQKVTSLTKIFFEFLIPVGSYFTGWSLILTSFLLLNHNKHKK